MDNRSKREQFRKRRRNYFKRGHENGMICGVELFVIMVKKNTYYTFKNTSRPFVSQEELDRNFVVAKTEADFQTDNAEMDGLSEYGAPSSPSIGPEKDLETVGNYPLKREYTFEPELHNFNVGLPSVPQLLPLKKLSNTI